MESLAKMKKLDQEIEAPADFTSPEALYEELIAATVSYTHLDQDGIQYDVYDSAGSLGDHAVNGPSRGLHQPFRHHFQKKTKGTAQTDS